MRASWSEKLESLLKFKFSASNELYSLGFYEEGYKKLTRSIINQNFVGVARQAVRKVLVQIQLDEMKLKMKMKEGEQQIFGTETDFTNSCLAAGTMNDEDMKAFIACVYDRKVKLPFFEEFFDKLDYRVSKHKSCYGLILEFIKYNFLMTRRNYRMLESKLVCKKNHINPSKLKQHKQLDKYIRLAQFGVSQNMRQEKRKMYEVGRNLKVKSLNTYTARRLPFIVKKTIQTLHKIGIN